jgi:type I restriction enzyme, R subunit
MQVSKEYSEDELVEQSAIKEYLALGYSHQNCFDEVFGPKGTLCRETKSEVLILPRLRDAILRLNPGIKEEAVKKAIDELSADRSRLSLVKANEEIYKLLKEGVKVKLSRKKDVSDDYTVRLIDYANPKNNDFFLASQFWISGEIYNRRADLIGFVNGIPLLFMELKATHKRLEDAYNDNLTDYKDTIPQIFHYNAFIVLSNGRESKTGTITSGFEHFNEWKKISNEKEKGVVSLDTIIMGTCDPNRFLDLLENFLIYTTIDAVPVKILAKNHQFLGVNNAVESFTRIKENQGKLGVFWHTQGAGKSYSMIFFAQKILRKFPGNYTFLVVTDRDDLDTQIYDNFQFAGVVTEKRVQAESGKHLKQLLGEDHRLIFTLIQKFRTDKYQTYPKLSDRDDIIVIADEAHRTQYDTFAQNMHDALPNAAFIGFTGTPLMMGEEKTRETFGDYVSIYNFKESVDDHATVPLYYENRIPEVQLKNADLNEDIYEIVEKAELDEMQEEKLAREFSREYQIITRDQRLETVAEDIVDHFINRGYEGKAMVVAIDKFTAVKMYDKVQKHLAEYIKKLEKKAEKMGFSQESKQLLDRIESLKKLDMAVVVSQELNEVSKFKKAGLDITKHRKRMVTEDLEKLFKNSDSDFQIVFVCNMWMTGFDVPSLSTIYLDKPMKNHTLMQAIARANRVFKEKTAGFIVDYMGIFRNLNKALAIYAASRAGEVDYPIQSKEKLVEDLKNLIEKINRFLLDHSVKPDKIIETPGLKKIALLEDARNAVLESDETKKKFLSDAGVALKVYKAIMPHKKASDYKRYIALYTEIILQIKSLDPEVDISDVMGDIQKVLDDSVETSRYIIKEKPEQKQIDLSKIDFDALKKEFNKKKRNTELERLKNVLSYKLRDMILINNTRIDFQETFQELIDEYNSGSSNIEETYKKLIEFGKSLEDEDRRAIREGLSDEELALFDKLKKQQMPEKEKNQVKKVAKDLLEALKNEKLVLDWRKKQQTRAAVKLEIEMELDKGLPDPPYDKKLFEEKCQVVFQHVYDSYYGEGKSVFQHVHY